MEWGIFGMIKYVLKEFSGNNSSDGSKIAAQNFLCVPIHHQFCIYKQNIAEFKPRLVIVLGQDLLDMGQKARFSIEIKFWHCPELKFRYSEKATEFDKTLVLTSLSNVKTKMEISSNCVAFSENLKFI